MIVRNIFFAFIVVAKCGADGDNASFDNSQRADPATCMKHVFDLTCIKVRSEGVENPCANNCTFTQQSVLVECDYDSEVDMVRVCQAFLPSNGSTTTTASSTSTSTTVATSTTTIQSTTTTSTTTTTTTENPTTSESMNQRASTDENSAESAQSTFEKTKYFIFILVGVLILLLLAVCLGVYCKTRKHRKRRTKMEKERFQNLKSLETHLQELTPMQQKSAAPTSTIGGETEIGGSSKTSTMTSRHNKTKKAERPISEKPSQASSAQSDVF